MKVISEDGFWELVDGEWKPTPKQASLSNPIPKPDIDGKPIPFVRQQVFQNQGETAINQTATENYASLSAFTTTKAHTHGVVNTLGNPFYQDNFSKFEYEGIQDPGAEKIKYDLINVHSGVESTARSKFSTGEKTYSAKQIIRNMLYEDENIVNKSNLKIREVGIKIPTLQTNTGLTEINNSEHFGVRGIITNKRILLVDSTEDAISKLRNPTSEYRHEFMQRRVSGVFEVSHKIMHDFWIKSILHEDINGAEFHFSDFSESKRIVKRFHHPGSIALAIMGCFAFFFSFLDNNFAVVFFTFIFISLALMIGAALVWYFISRIVHYRMNTTFGKKRNLTIGYFDKVYNQNLILSITLEDSQTISDTTDWLRLLQDYSK